MQLRTFPSPIFIVVLVLAAQPLEQQAINPASIPTACGYAAVDNALAVPLNLDAKCHNLPITANHATVIHGCTCYFHQYEL